MHCAHRPSYPASKLPSASHNRVPSEEALGSLGPCFHSLCLCPLPCHHAPIQASHPRLLLHFLGFPPFMPCRKDMAALEHRAATLDLSEGCARCGVAVGEPPPATAGISGGCVPPFYLFPSGNAFHGTCLAHEVMQLVPPPQQQRIHTLLTTLSQVLNSPINHSHCICLL